MTAFQRVMKYVAMGFAILLAVGIIGGVLGLFGFFGGDAVTKDLKVYSVPSGIHSIEVEINAADFKIAQGERFFVESNLKYLTVKAQNGALKIEETKKFGVTYADAVLTLYVPASVELKKVEITTGAGRLTADRLSAAAIELELGAGEVRIDTLVATTCINIEGGAGKFTVSDGALRNLDLEMGVGQLNLTCALTGDSDLDLGVGESNITVLGNRDDYRLNIEKGIGNIALDGKSVSNIKENGKGKNSIEVNGGVGAINLKFKESFSK